MNKEDMDKLISVQDNIALKVATIEIDIANVKEDLTRLHSIETGVHTVIATLNEIKGILSKQDTEQTSTKRALSWHEKRIERLEKEHGIEQVAATA